MDDIEKRAWEKLAQVDINEERRKMYNKIAAEQKAIDINKACKWLKVNYGHFDGSIEDLVADFRKAMEEK